MNWIVRKFPAQQKLSLYEYIHLCLFDEEHGYYRHHQPLGSTGDFVTSPEISPFFGECIGFWVIQQWINLGRPQTWHLIELGPGSGRLMQDVLRVLQKSPAPFFHPSIILLEINKTLKHIQKKALQEYAHLSVQWVENLDQVNLHPNAPVIIIANEFFDVFPIRRFQCINEGLFQEDFVILDNEHYTIQPSGSYVSAESFTNFFPQDFYNQLSVGAVVEVNPDILAMYETISQCMRRQQGSAIFIDYGYMYPQLAQTTLQAMHQHRKVSIFDFPGQADITAHVNFYALFQYFQQRNFLTQVKTQREFLKDWGIDWRLQKCITTKPEKTNIIRDGYERIVYHMGDLFKVCTIGTFEEHS